MTENTGKMNEGMNIDSSGSGSSSSGSNSSRTLMVVRGISHDDVKAQEEAYKLGEVKYTGQIHDNKPLEVMRLEEKKRQGGDQDQSQTSSSTSPSKLDLILNNRAATIGSQHHTNDRLAKIREESDHKRLKDLK